MISTVQDLGQGLWRIRRVLDALNSPPRPRPRPAPADSTSSTRTAGGWSTADAPGFSPRHATTPEAVDALVAFLTNPHRTHPVVVITTSPDRVTCWINPDTVARELTGLAWVAVVPTGRLTFHLNDAIGRDTGVYGGAGRVYPAATDAHPPRLGDSRLRTAYDHTHGARVADALGTAAPIGDI